ncbi:MAG: carboxypeptidase-like regulatory domain-containing protein [Saprospiraceae bacterium]|nr:carboxypeptidase-like regulatory domain-containing protein [Saprospiraceae bacterium]
MTRLTVKAIHFSRFLSVLLMFLAFVQVMKAQMLSGLVLDNDSSTPLAYVNIGVVGLGVGTVSNEDGRYTLLVSNLDDDALLRFSILGYQSVDLSLKAVRSEPDLASSIRLTPVALDLPPITVNPKDYKERRVGNELSNHNFGAGFFYNDLGNELGTMVKIKARPAFIDQINLHLAWCKYDTIFYRLNIYRVDHGEPVERIYSSPLIIDYRDHQGHDVFVDIAEEQIVVYDDFMVSLELIRELGEGGLMFCAGFLKDKTWYRKTSQAAWESANVGIGISVDIRQETK